MSDQPDDNFLSELQENRESEITKTVEMGHDKVRMNIWVKRSLHEGAMDIAREEDWTLTDVVREALKRYVRYYKSQTRRK